MRNRLLFYLKVAVLAPWFAIACCIGYIYDLIRWGDPSNGSRFSSLLAKVGLPLMGVKLNVVNRERLYSSQPCVYVANHLSDADIFIYGAIYPRNTVIIGKKEVRKIPFFGAFFEGAGNILIDRGDHQNAMIGMEQAAKWIRDKGLACWVFVEGHRNLHPPMLPFKKGAFHLAVMAGVPIVPIVCQPYGHVIDQGNHTAPGGTVSIHVLEPISCEGKTADELLTLARARMEMEIAKWSK